MRLFAAVLLVALLPHFTGAREKARAATPFAASVPVATPTSSDPPAPGACSYSQPGVKRCAALLDGQGAFDVFTAPPAFLYVRTEEPIVNVIPPDPHFFQTDRRDNTVVIVPIRDKLPALTPAVITTQSLTITLNVRPGTRERADTQLTVLDPLRTRRNAQLAEAAAALEPRVFEKIHGRELDDLARSGAELLPVRGKTIARNAELIVLRALRVLRAGSRRYLFFTLQNRSADPYQVKGVRLSVRDHEEHAAWRMIETTVASAQTGPGVLELPATCVRGTRLKIRVDEVDARRTVELTKLEAP